MSDTLEVQGQLNFPNEIRRYIMGGNSTFTLVSKKTGVRFTYKVKSAPKDKNKNWSTGNQDKDLFFVSLLTGPSNSDDFVYLGLLRKQNDGSYQFGTTAKSRARQGAPSHDAFAFIWNAIEQGATFPSGVEFWHEGSCCMCGRKLTVPESIASGIGPECAAKGGM